MWLEETLNSRTRSSDEEDPGKEAKKQNQLSYCGILGVEGRRRFQEEEAAAKSGELGDGHGQAEHLRQLVGKERGGGPLQPGGELPPPWTTLALVKFDVCKGTTSPLPPWLAKEHVQLKPLSLSGLWATICTKNSLINHILEGRHLYVLLLE